MATSPCMCVHVCCPFRGPACLLWARDAPRLGSEDNQLKSSTMVTAPVTTSDAPCSPSRSLHGGWLLEPAHLTLGSASQAGPLSSAARPSASQADGCCGGHALLVSAGRPDGTVPSTVSMSPRHASPIDPASQAGSTPPVAPVAASQADIGCEGAGLLRRTVPPYGTVPGTVGLPPRQTRTAGSASQAGSAPSVTTLPASPARKVRDVPALRRREVTGPFEGTDGGQHHVLRGELGSPRSRRDVGSASPAEPAPLGSPPVATSVTEAVWDMRACGMAQLVVPDTPGHEQPHGLAPRLTGPSLTLQRGPRDTLHNPLMRVIVR